MDSAELPVVLEFAIAADLTLDRLMQLIFNGNQPDEAIEMLKCHANQHLERDDGPLTALHYYRGMRYALNEEDFRWLKFEDTPDPITRRKLRRDRAQLYRKYRELFTLDIAIARRRKRDGIALSEDWSQLKPYAKDALAIARHKLMLYTAELLFRVGIPGALDICDAAAFGLFDEVYLRA